MWGCRAETEGTTGNSKKRHEIKWGKAETTDRENPPAAEKAGSSAGESGGLQLSRADVMDLLVPRVAAESETTYAPSLGYGCSNNRNWPSQLAFNFLLGKWEWQLKGYLLKDTKHTIWLLVLAWKTANGFRQPLAACKHDLSDFFVYYF